MPPAPSYPIVTPRLRLRPLTVADIGELLNYRGRPDVCRYLPFEPTNEQVLRARLDGDGTSGAGRSQLKVRP